MALYRFRCLACQAPETRLLKLRDVAAFVAGATCRACGAGSLRRDANPPAVTKMETIDRGTSARAVEQIAGIRELVHDRNLAAERAAAMAK